LTVVDLGCGGGIYSRGFASLGAKSVIGIDLSPRYIDEAQKASGSFSVLRFAMGSADNSGLPDRCADIVFHRAVIHHLNAEGQARGAAEMYRILESGGKCVVQDRTLEDVESARPDHWVRSTLFEVFPRLLETERARRPTTAAYAKIMKESGFGTIDVLQYAETRKRYSSFEELETEILARKGKSILFELSDAELRTYCKALAQKRATPPIIEADSWTVWIGTKL
jgi:SAM-dependent methyltransferase